MKRCGIIVIATVVTVVLLAGPACGSATASFGFAPSGNSLEILNAYGAPDNLAGSHPDKVIVKFAFNAKEEVPEGNARTLRMELPPGFVGDAGAVPTCGRAVYDRSYYTSVECPPTTQVGNATFDIPGRETEIKPIFNIEPAPGQLAELGVTNVAKVPMTLKLRPSDLGVTIEQSELLQGAPIISGEVELWGVPADHQETPQPTRGAFLTLPTNCSGSGVNLRLLAIPWQSSLARAETTVSSEKPLYGCQELAFHPKLNLSLTNPQVDSPTGVTTTIELPGKEGSDERSEAILRTLSMEMPEGMSVSPGGLAQREACTGVEFDSESCPARARIGEAVLTSPLLDRTIRGSLYLGEAESDHRFQLYVAVSSDEVSASLVGTIKIAPSTTRITVELPGLPQIPLDKATMKFEGGPDALLVTSLSCGRSVANGEVESYSGGAREPVEAFVQTSAPGSGCASGTAFRPEVVAGTSSRIAGSPSALEVLAVRQSGESLFKSLTVALPPGVSAALGRVRPCPAGESEAGLCSEESHIGDSSVQLGSGESVAVLNGAVFLTRERGQFAMALVIPAKIGPYDLGTVVLRGAIESNLLTGASEFRLTKMPQTIEGVSIRLRSLAVDIDRGNFIRNPTTCRPLHVVSTLGSTSDVTWEVRSPFQVSRCTQLRFEPRLRATLSGGRSRAAADRARSGAGAERLNMKVAVPRRSTALAGMTVQLPRDFRPHIAGIGDVCSNVGARKGKCPKGARIGSVWLKTPLFGRPLQGGTYAVQPKGRGLPEIWAIVSAPGARMALRGAMKHKADSWTISFRRIPDIPVSIMRFAFGVNRGGAFATRVACGRKRRALPETSASFRGQDGALRLSQLSVTVLPCRKSVGRRGAATATESGAGGR